MINQPSKTHARLFELDAVRAFSITIVVLFHLRVVGFSFGYLGVDIFFVLSGYLMTHNVIRDQENGDKALVRIFVKKRFLRIIPPFIITALVTTLISIMIYSPAHLAEVGEQVLRAITFNSNILFYGQAGYFAPANELQPMLHSWSLSVEEQFYVLFALLIFLSRYIRLQTLLIWAFFISLIVYGLLCLQTLNLSFELIGAWPEKEKSEDALFYLTSFRMIQFLSGASMALLHRKTRPAFGTLLSAVLLLTAFGLLYTIETFGMLALSNLLASLAAITLLQKNKLTAWAGQLSPVKFIARSSYQIYLVHWPLIVFWRYITLNELGVIEQVALAAMSVLLGWWLMKFTNNITSPAHWHRLSNNNKLGWAGTLAVAVGLASTSIQSEGYPSRVPADRDYISALEYREQESAYCDGSHLGIDREYGDRLGDPVVTCDVNSDGAETIYVLGDSHARHLAPGLAKHFPGHRIATMYFTNCHAQSGVGEYVYEYEGRTALKEACLVRNAEAMKLFAATPKATIIIHQFIGYDRDASPEFFEASKLLLRKLESYGHNVIWLGGVVQPNKLMEGCNDLPITFPTRFIKTRCHGEKETAERILKYNKMVNGKFPEQYLNMSVFFCSEHKNTVCITTHDGKALFRDKHHLTIFGSEQFIEFAITQYPNKFPIP